MSPHLDLILLNNQIEWMGPFTTVPSSIFYYVWFVKYNPKRFLGIWQTQNLEEGSENGITSHIDHRRLIRHDKG